jgi:acyl-coenzyme A thioesterase PaaI-like protein
MSESLPVREVVHLRAHLGVRLDRTAEDTVRGLFELSTRTRTSDGRLSLGALATIVDVGAMFAARVAQGGTAHVTTHLALRVPVQPTGRRLYVDSKVVRVGRANVVSAVHVSDDDGTVVGVATVTSGALGGAGGSHQPDFQRPEGDFYDPPVVPGEGPPIDEFVTLTPVGLTGATRTYQAPFLETLRNVNGVLHGGGAAVLVEQAARRAVLDAGMEAPVIDSLDIHYVAPGLVGPFVVAVEAVGGGTAHVAMLVTMTDEGRDGRTVAVGMVGCHGR